MTQFSLTGKRWILRQPRGTQLGALIPSLCAERAIDPTLDLTSASLMAPDLFPSMQDAVRITRDAMTDGRKISIFGDYDCDGVTATAQIVRFFLRHGVTPHVRLPHRVKDGYGLKDGTIEELHALGTELLITVDTGISSLGPITLAKEHGMQVIVLDHHHVPAMLPPADALVHPALSPAFPHPHPSAAGIAFTYVTALEQSFGSGSTWTGAEVEMDIALAAVGTVADVVPLQGHNRSLVRQGIGALQRMQGSPLWTLLASTGSPGALTSRDIAFRIAPRLNAAGRMADPMIALKALLGDQQSLAALDSLNRERQEQTATLLEELLEDESLDFSSPFLASVSERYPPGIAGLLAGKLTELYGKPSIVGHVRGDLVTASLRSPPCYSIIDGLTACADLLMTFGGHAQAAGCTFEVAKAPLLFERLEQHILDRVDADELCPSLLLEAELSPAHITADLLREITLLEPFGQGNPEPRFLLRSILLSEPRIVGSSASHIQARIGPHKAIGFKLGDHFPLVTEPLDLACRVGFDTWQGRVGVQLYIDDLRVAARTASPIGEYRI
ncbi:MAG: DHH family phosphoesterase [Candidatus Peregrinibacteria bacterium]|nr:DHH family phosphoesterase [Candidatus Peregrinibacteria bacterium]